MIINILADLAYFALRLKVTCDSPTLPCPCHLSHPGTHFRFLCCRDFFHRSCCYDSGLKTSVLWLFNFTFGAEARELLLLFCGLFAYVEWGVMESGAGGAVARGGEGG